MKNSLIKLFCRLCKPRRTNPFNSSSPRILIVSTTALGDTLWSTPIIYDIRKTYKEAYIAALTGSLGYEALKNNPFLDKVYILEKVPLSLLMKLRKEKFEAILIFHASQRIVLPLMHLLGAEKIIGSRGKNKGLDALLTHPVQDLRNIHEIERRQNIAKGIGVEISTKRIFFYPALEKSLNLKKPLVALHPGASSSFRRWPRENFILLAKGLKEKGFQIVFTGSLKEKELVLSLSSEIEGAKALYNLSISQLAAFLKEEVSLFVIADTGPLHLASGMETKTIALFSPTAPSSCGSLSSNTFTFYYPPSCDVCLKKKCLNNLCMQKILVEEVLDKALKLLS